MEEINMMKKLKYILALGILAHKQIIHCINGKQSNYKFKHGIVHELPELKWKLVNSYHTSRYNINTKKITYEMFLAIIKKLGH